MGFLRLLSFSLAFLAITTFVPTYGDIAELCKGTDYPVLCKSIVKTVKDGSSAEATRAAISATILHVVQAKTKANKLIGSLDDAGKENLKVCKEVYDDALSNLKTSLNNLKAMSLNDLNINLSAAISDFGTCDDGFAETTPDGTSPLATANELLHKLASNSLALASGLRA